MYLNFNILISLLCCVGFSSSVMNFLCFHAESPIKILKKDEIKIERKAALYDDVVLECELSRANCVVSWYKNGSPIEENERFCFEEEGTFRTLVILCAELQDSGEYILDAKDDKISFHVTVQGRNSVVLM